MKTIALLALVLCLTALWTSGCEHAQEPWVPDPDVLQQERARSPETERALHRRFIQVQTDR